ncbi:hypothetical protein DFH11DRAFT_1783342, partial [Phellopilus nigrolimitatus]
FDDGNVFLATTTYIFRVHKGILSLNSTVFRSMFSLPQPIEGEDSYKGLPVVQLVGDRDDEVAILLRAMYERNFYRKNQPTAFWTICALLRLSTKYAVDNIRKEVIDHLAMVYPSTLAECDAVHEGKMASVLFRPFRQHDFALLSLARACSADILLPALFYECASHSVDTILDYKPDGSWPGWIGNDLGVCLAGRHKLLVAIRETVFKFLDAPSPTDCVSSRSSCFTAKQTRYVENYMFFTINPAVFRRELIKILCSSCQSALKSSLEEGRNELWKKLPEFFGLPKWEILEGNAATL